MAEYRLSLAAEHDLEAIRVPGAGCQVYTYRSDMERRAS